MNPRDVAVAMRCKLLTGIYDGATRSCDCNDPGDCHLHRDTREALKDHPKVVEARENNFVEYSLFARSGIDFGQRQRKNPAS